MNTLVRGQSEVQSYSWGGSTGRGFLGQNFGEFKSKVNNTLNRVQSLKGPRVQMFDD